MTDVPYRDFYYPLNVFMHILTNEEGSVSYLHYGVFEREGEPIGEAQERSTSMLLERLPAPPARLLDVGVGLATTLARLHQSGYDATGITPDEKQVAMARERHGALRIECIGFEDFESAQPFDVVIFQESSQYIDAEALFERARRLTRRVIVLDEFAIDPEREASSLPRLDRFLSAAQAAGFVLTENVDLTDQAAPTIGYFIDRIPRYRTRLIGDLGLTDVQVDELIASGIAYRDLYRTRVYGYRLLQFAHEPSSS
ncbi:MAG: SAM-dependent methyltransferase [Thermoanaerobaculia bacterium]